MAKKAKQPEVDPRLQKYEEFAAAHSGQYALINADGDLLSENTYDLIRTPSEGFVAFKNDGKNGFLRLDGTVAVEPIYESVADFHDGLAAVKKDGLWGFIDVNGNVVIPIEYDNSAAPYFRDGLAYVKKDGKYGYIDMTGAMVIEPVYEYAYAFADGMACVKQDGLIGCINHKGEMVIPALYAIKPGYTSIWRGDFAVAMLKNKFGMLDRQGNVVLPFEYDAIDFSPTPSATLMEDGDEKYYKFSVKPGGTGMVGAGRVVIEPIYSTISEFNDGIAAAEKDGKGGYIDAEGNTVLPFEYDSVSPFSRNFNNYAKVTKDKRSFIIDRSGREICDKLEKLDFRRDDLPPIGYIGAVKDDKYGMLDKEGNFILPCQFDSIEQWGCCPYVMVEKEGKYGLYDFAGHEILKPVYERIYEPRDEKAPVSIILERYKNEGVISTDAKFIVNPEASPYCKVEVQDAYPVIKVTDQEGMSGLLRYDGSKITDCVFDSIQNFSADGIAIACIGKKFGLINAEGQWVIPAEYDYIEQMSEGLAAAKKDGKWGFVNDKNEWVIAPAYDRLYKGFMHGYAIVFNGDKLILINKAGKELTKPAANLRLSDPAEGMIRFLVGRKYGYLNLEGGIAIKPTFEEAEDFEDGCAQVSLKIDKEPMWTFVKKDGATGEPFQNRVSKFGSLIPVEKGDRKAVYLPDGTLAIPFVLKNVSRDKDGVTVIQFA